ncbi:MAG: DinB family protein [Anaerolineaceae bacterium]|nr:DinB family protein [Anaerolineaceae bacterium]
MSKRAVLLDALASMPKDLGFMLRRAEETAVHHRPTPQDWSIADVLVHLAAIEPLYLARLQKIVAEERPFLPYLHPETKPEPDPRPLAELVTAVGEARQQTLTFLHACKAGDWQRPAVHETLGDTKFRFVVQLLVDHDTEHLNQIIQIQEKLKSQKT